MSHHFRILRESGLVVTRAEGTVHRNALRRQEMNLRFPGLLDVILGLAAESARARKTGK